MKSNNEFCNTPRIYVACLASYNNGYLHGAWIDVENKDEVGIYAEIKKMIDASPVSEPEEFAIHDYDGFGECRISEYESITSIVKIADFITEHGVLGSAVLTHVNGDIEEAQKLLQECYYGEFESEVGFAMSFAEDTMTIPDHLAYYIDYEKMARDWFISDFFSIELNYKTHIFSC